MHTMDHMQRIPKNTAVWQTGTKEQVKLDIYTFSKFCSTVPVIPHHLLPGTHLHICSPFHPHSLVQGHTAWITFHNLHHFSPSLLCLCVMPVGLNLAYRSITLWRKIIFIHPFSLIICGQVTLTAGCAGYSKHPLHPWVPAHVMAFWDVSVPDD